MLEQSSIVKKIVLIKVFKSDLHLYYEESEPFSHVSISIRKEDDISIAQNCAMWLLNFDCTSSHSREAG